MGQNAIFIQADQRINVLEEFKSYDFELNQMGKFDLIRENIV